MGARGLKEIAFISFSCPRARNALVEPQNGQSNPVSIRKKQKCIFGRSSRRSILKKYSAMPEEKEHNNITAQILRRINEEEISAVFAFANVTSC